MSHYTIHCVGFDQAQQSSIEAILDLADSALNHSWSIIESSDTDIVMIKMPDEKALQLDSKYDSFAKYRIILTAESPQDRFQDYWYLEKKDQAPPSLRVFVNLLNQVGIALIENISADLIDEQEKSLAGSEKEDIAQVPEQNVEAALNPLENNKPEEDLIQIDKEVQISSTDDVSLPTVSDDTKETSRKLSADNYLFGLLLEAKKDKKYRVITLNQLPVLYIASGYSSFFSGTEEELLQYCQVMPEKLSVKLLTRTEFNKAIVDDGTELEGKNLISLIDFAVVYASQGQLLDGHSEKQQFTLMAMPNMEDDAIFSGYKEIAELMHRREGNLLDFAESLKIPVSDIADFYNVCYIRGNIEIAAIKDAGSGANDTKTVESESFSKDEQSRTVENNKIDNAEPLKEKSVEEVHTTQENIDKPEKSLKSDQIEETEQAQEQSAEDVHKTLKNNRSKESDLTQVDDSPQTPVIDTPKSSVKAKIKKPSRKLLAKNYLFGVLMDARKDTKYRIITLDKLPALYIASGYSSFFSGTEKELLQYCMIAPKKLNIKLLSRAKFNKALSTESTELEGKNLISLIDFTIVYASQGQLLDGHSVNQRFTLMEIPDMEKNSTLRQYKEIAELMLHREGSVLDFAGALQVPVPDVSDFYNVCYLRGYIKIVDAQESDPDSENSKTVGGYLKSFFTKK